jgi:hypothetical protein
MCPCSRLSLLVPAHPPWLNTSKQHRMPKHVCATTSMPHGATCWGTWARAPHCQPTLVSSEPQLFSTVRPSWGTVAVLCVPCFETQLPTKVFRARCMALVLVCLSHLGCFGLRCHLSPAMSFSKPCLLQLQAECEQYLKLLKGCSSVRCNCAFVFNGLEINTVERADSLF